MIKNHVLMTIIVFIFFTVGIRPGSELLASETSGTVQVTQSQSDEVTSDLAVKNSEVEMNNAEIKENQLSQNEIDIITNSSGEQLIPLNNKSGLFMRIIKPCPNIDYKIRILPGNPNIDPGIYQFNPDQYNIIPGVTEQSCNQIYQVSYPAGK
jgi:hypothetical protein